MGRAVKKINRDVLDAVMQKFNEMPAKPEANSLPLNDAFLSLRPAISEMQKKGYSLNEILDFLKESGITVGLTTLKSAISKPRKKLVSAPTKQVKIKEMKVKNTEQIPVQIKASPVQDPDEK